MLDDIARRLDALEASRGQLVRIGKVVARDASRGAVSVQFPDADGLVSQSLPVMYAKTHKDKFFFLPDIGEQVVCLFLGNGLEMGVVIGALYSGPDPVPVASGDKHHVRFSDGAIFEYDRAAHALSISIPGTVNVTAAGTVTINGQRIDLNP